MIHLFEAGLYLTLIHVHVYEACVGLRAYDLSAGGNIFVAQLLCQVGCTCIVFNVPLENITFIWTSQLQLRTVKYTCKPLLGAYCLLSKCGSLSYHT